ncbi:DUF308 domain-containing protein (plasmid) [Streptomyces anulatus]|uniref:DUF308 domain-containing protein n=1 Tax=Streptomyces anulatus TaxID=1892 RepID=UPI002F915CB9
MTLPRDAAEPTGRGADRGRTVPGAMDDPVHVLARLGRSWTWLMGSAVATLVPGVLALVTENLPHRSLVMGVAVLAMVAGIVVLALPAESARALTRLLGLWLVLLGLAEVVVALGWRAALRGARTPNARPPR